MLSTKLLGSELVEERLGSWPTFHDAEILTMVLDRGGPTLLVRILIGVPIRPPETWTPEAVKAWTHFEVSLRFNEVDSLELCELNHQNVIGDLVLSSITEERRSKLATEERVKVEIHSVWGLGGSFTCSGGEVISIEETGLRTGYPRGLPNAPDSVPAPRGSPAEAQKGCTHN
jgi:hypothetical protein